MWNEIDHEFTFFSVTDSFSSKIYTLAIILFLSHQKLHSKNPRDPRVRKYYIFPS